jgi:hypothetical protein
LNYRQEQICNASFLLRKSELKEKLMVLRKDPLLRNETRAISLKGKLLFCYLNYFNRLVLQEYKPALTFALRYLELISGNDSFRELNQMQYLQGYSMIITCLQFLPEPVLLEKYLNELRNITVKNNWMEAAKFQLYSGSALYFYHENSREKEFLEVARWTRTNLALYQASIKVDLKLGMYSTLAEGYLKFGKYTEAIDVIELYRQNPPPDTRNDYQNYLLFFYLIAQFETGNHQLVSNLLTNMSRFMKRTTEFSELENRMLKVFGIAIEMPDKRARNLALNEMKTKIRKTAEDLGGRRWMNHVSIIIPFIDSRISNLKYHEHMLRNNVKNEPV